MTEEETGTGDQDEDDGDFLPRVCILSWKVAVAGENSIFETKQDGAEGEEEERFSHI